MFQYGLPAMLAAAVFAGLLTWNSGQRPDISSAAVAAPVAPAPAVPAKPVPPPVLQPPPVDVALRSGVLIVISKASQQMYVYKDGRHWRTSPVSTGRRGKATPAGIFPILQKRVFHRSNLYSNAPMPYMQRLTWSGIAIHAGHLPGYAASHGCIRLPRQFARELYGVTRSSTTTVVVTNEALASSQRAQDFALSLPPLPPVLAPGQSPAPSLAPAPRLANAAPPTIAAVPPVVFPVVQTRAGPSGNIQLAAAISPAEAEAHWARLLGQRPELARFEKSVIPAVVGSRQVYRLRIAAANPKAVCLQLKSAGIDCFSVS